MKTTPITDWKELTVIHEESTKLTVQLTMLKEMRQARLDYCTTDHYRDLPESSQNLILDSIERHSQKIAVLTHQYQILNHRLNQNT